MKFDSVVLSGSARFIGDSVEFVRGDNFTIKCHFGVWDKIKLMIFLMCSWGKYTRLDTKIHFE